MTDRSWASLAHTLVREAARVEHAIVGLDDDWLEGWCVGMRDAARLLEVSASQCPEQAREPGESEQDHDDEPELIGLHALHDTEQAQEQDDDEYRDDDAEDVHASTPSTLSR
ncbi:MAG: hypothetical protein WAT66_04405 [Actinomycetota bacterium]